MKTLAIVLVFSLVRTSDAAPDVEQLLSTLGSQIEQAWYRDRDTRAWLLADGAGDGVSPPACAKTLEGLRDARGQIEVRYESRDLAVGRHPLAAARRACDAIERQARIKRFERAAQLAADGIGGVKTFEQCIALYDGLVGSGISPSEQVPATTLSTRAGDITWSGTIESVRVTYCDGPLAKARAQAAVAEAPYRKLLRNAKLTMALGSSTGFTLIGGETTRDPAKLAAATVWFDALSDLTGNETCPHGAKRKTLRRYQFDGAHQLVKQTARDFCGEIPVAALR